MHSTRHIRKAVIAFGLAASLLIPQVALAATSSGNTPETLEVASTITAQFPLSATYNDNKPSSPGWVYDNTYYETPEQVVTIVATNDPDGLTLSAHVDEWTGPVGTTVPTTKREALISGYSGIGGGAQLVPVGSGLTPGIFADSSTEVTLATADGPLTNRQIGLAWGVGKSNFTVAGTYSSTVHYTAATN